MDKNKTKFIASMLTPTSYNQHRDFKSPTRAQSTLNLNMKNQAMNTSSQINLKNQMQACSTPALNLIGNGNGHTSGFQKLNPQQQQPMPPKKIPYEPVRITGYLEKRSKVFGWKKYWFVLDGRLLTYYKSKTDYDSLSSCIGSINVGIASTVRPTKINGCKGFPLQIVTRSQVFYLRFPDKPSLDLWLIAIQEAASSPPKISFPYWTDPGAQFYRYSFAALSQWSLNASSSDDITASLQHLPQNYYLRKDGYSSSSTAGGPSIIKKCHSIASLNHPPREIQFIDKKRRDFMQNNNNMRRQEDEIKDTNSKVRHASSMLMLESSPQAAELRKELTRKLSAGSSSQTNKKCQNKTSKLNERHSLGNMQLNQFNLDDESHHYDEILDFKTENESIYEPCGDEFSSDNNNDNEIYENVDPWEKLESSNNVVKRHSSSSAHSGHRISSGSNRNSLLSISELPENNNASSLSSMEQRTQWKAMNFGRGDEEFFSSHSQSVQPLTYSPEKSGRKWKIGGFLQEMFNKDKHEKINKKKKEKSSPNEMVITGPIDLKSKLYYQQQQQLYDQEKIQKGKEILDNQSLKSSPANSLRKSPFPNEDVMDELKQKIGKMNRKISNESVSSTTPIDSERESSRRSTSNSTDTLKCNNTSVIHSMLVTHHQKSLDLLPILRQKNPEEFQEKLEKFNRLSAQLSPSFVAALNPPLLSPTFGQIGRSNSLSRSRNLDKDNPPALPPKRKHNPQSSKPIYDTPKNNTAVKKHKLSTDSENETPTNEQVPFRSMLRSLTKKNSAPDMLFSSRSSTSRNSEENLHIFRQSLGGGDDVFDEDVKVDKVVVPPRPPKKLSRSRSNSYTDQPTPSAFNYIDYNNSKNNEKNSQMEETSEIPSLPNSQPPSPDLLKTSSLTTINLGFSNNIRQKLTLDLPNDNLPLPASPTPSKKSIDIDSLEVLSDLSDTINLANAEDEFPPPPDFNDRNVPESVPIPIPPPLPEVYENLKYATMHTLMLELETVEETAEDEMLEMYDEFPVDCPPPPAIAKEIYLPEPDYNDEEKNYNNSIRHSGIDQLKSFLNFSNENAHDDLPEFSAGQIRHGAVSRLGHSSAVNQLQNLVGKEKSN